MAKAQAQKASSSAFQLGMWSKARAACPKLALFKLILSSLILSWLLNFGGSASHLNWMSILTELRKNRHGQSSPGDPELMMVSR